MGKGAGAVVQQDMAIAEMTRGEQIVALLTERRGEKLTAADVTAALGAGYVENVRAQLKRLVKSGDISVDYEIRSYKVGSSVCRHKAALWYVANDERAHE